MSREKMPKMPGQLQKLYIPHTSMEHLVLVESQGLLYLSHSLVVGQDRQSHEDEDDTVPANTKKVEINRSKIHSLATAALWHFSSSLIVKNVGFFNIREKTFILQVKEYNISDSYDIVFQLCILYLYVLVDLVNTAWSLWYPWTQAPQKITGSVS